MIDLKSSVQHSQAQIEMMMLSLSLSLSHLDLSSAIWAQSAYTHIGTHTQREREMRDKERVVPGPQVISRNFHAPRGERMRKKWGEGGGQRAAVASLRNAGVTLDQIPWASPADHPIVCSNSRGILRGSAGDFCLV